MPNSNPPGELAVVGLLHPGAEGRHEEAAVPAVAQAGAAAVVVGAEVVAHLVGEGQVGRELGGPGGRHHEPGVEALPLPEEAKRLGYPNELSHVFLFWRSQPLKKRSSFNPVPPNNIALRYLVTARLFTFYPTRQGHEHSLTVSL